MSRPIGPGAVLGVLGSGQLGRMLALEARRLGYRVHVFSPEADSPAGQVADLELVAPYEDADAVRRFARGVDVVTFEFENVPAASAAAAAEHAPVRPDGAVLHVTQQRLREKGFLRARGLPVPEFAAVRSAAELEAGLAAIVIRVSERTDSSAMERPVPGEASSRVTQSMSRPSMTASISSTADGLK